ncbi:MAG: response regulator [Myxococcota bacterium]
MERPDAPILIVDDEPDILELVGFHLEEAGFRVATASTGTAALDALRSGPPSLVVLDLMLPDLSGAEILRSLRAGRYGSREIPIIVLTARSGEVDRVVGFERGADDYVTKPFSPRELVLRVEALLRRARGPIEERAAILERGSIQMDRERHRCQVEGRDLALTSKEFELLAALLEAPGRVFSREHLLQRVWGGSIHVGPRTIDTHLRRLRAKLGPAGRRIETVRGVGYRLG